MTFFFFEWKDMLILFRNTSRLTTFNLKEPTQRIDSFVNGASIRASKCACVGLCRRSVWNISRVIYRPEISDIKKMKMPFKYTLLINNRYFLAFNPNIGLLLWFSSHCLNIPSFSAVRLPPSSRSCHFYYYNKLKESLEFCNNLLGKRAGESQKPETMASVAVSLPLFLINNSLIIFCSSPWVEPCTVCVAQFWVG